MSGLSSPVKIALTAALLGGVAVGMWHVSQNRQPAPGVELTSIKNQKLTLLDLRGKVVLVNFWATSCPGCIHEMPVLIDLQRKYQAKGYETVAVAMSYDPPNYVLNYAETNKLPFIVALDSTESIAKAFGGIRGTPTSFLIDKKGNIVRRYVGELKMEEVQPLVENKLQEPI